MARADLRDILVVAPGLHWRYSGVTSTIIALLPKHAQRLPIAAFGPFMPSKIPRLSLGQILIHGWSRPRDRPFRIWHARRNNDMIAGVLLKSLLRQPWRLVFTSASQRRHAGLTRWLIRRMDAVIATSEAGAAYLEAPPVVIHHGVDAERFHPAEDRAAAWAETGLPGRFGVGAFARIRPDKGSDLFVEAMIRLLPKYPDATAVLAGLVGAEHQAFAEDLKRRIAAAGLERRIVFLGQIPYDEMPVWCRRISLYVAPMRWEGFGLPPLEAMASGAAVVATRTGAVAQLVADGETGLLVAPDDLEALTAAIESLLADPDKASAMGRAGRAKALGRHDIDAEAAAIEAVYEALWAKAPPV